MTIKTLNIVIEESDQRIKSFTAMGIKVNVNGILNKDVLAFIDYLETNIDLQQLCNALDDHINNHMPSESDINRIREDIVKTLNLK